MCLDFSVFWEGKMKKQEDLTFFFITMFLGIVNLSLIVETIYLLLRSYLTQLLTYCYSFHMEHKAVDTNILQSYLFLAISSTCFQSISKQLRSSAMVFLQVFFALPLVLRPFTGCHCRATFGILSFSILIT